MAITGGVHSAEDVSRTQLVGAEVAQLASVLMQRGEGVLALMRETMLKWLDHHEYESLDQLRGSISYGRAEDPSGWERANYLDTLDQWRP